MPPRAGARFSLLVNSGNSLQRLSNGAFPSTMHTASCYRSRPRYSVPFFFSGNPDHEVRCLQACLSEDEQPHYPPTTVEAHLMEMYRRTYA